MGWYNARFVQFGVDGFSECVPDSGFPGMGLVLSIMLVVVVILGSLGVLGFWFCDFGCSGFAGF